MSKIAFELREDIREDFSGGTAALPGGKTFDLGEALEEGNGQIVLDPRPTYPDEPTYEGQPDSEEESAKRVEAAEAYSEEVAAENERAAADQRLLDTLDLHPALKRAKAQEADASGETPPDTGPTKTELEKRAQELEIPGRSSMDKEQLAEAIAEHEAGNASGDGESTEGTDAGGEEVSG